ncbi:hypothetical protein Tco_0199214 [Tanacetum coccineum]
MKGGGGRGERWLGARALLSVGPGEKRLLCERTGTEGLWLAGGRGWDWEGLRRCLSLVVQQRRFCLCEGWRRQVMERKGGESCGEAKVERFCCIGVSGDWQYGRAGRREGGILTGRAEVPHGERAL